MGVDLEARDPGERGRFALHRFLAFDGVKPPGSPLVIPIGQAVDPAVDLVNASGRRAFQRGSRGQALLLVGLAPRPWRLFQEPGEVRSEEVTTKHTKKGKPAC